MRLPVPQRTFRRLFCILVALVVASAGTLMRPSGAGELTTGLRAPMDPGPTALPRIDRTDSLEKVLELAAPELDPDVIKLALESQANAVRDGLVLDPLTLTVIDYSRPSDEARLFVFDLDAGRLLFKDLVAHGRNSGELRATQFSNVEGSFMTSLGLFRTLDPYVGEHGLSLRLEGLEPGFNDHAFDRGIVIHGADYVSGAFARREGRIGRSLGCPALPLASARRIIERIRGGSAVFSYFPEARWLSESRFFNEDGVPVAGSLRAAHGVRARSL